MNQELKNIVNLLDHAADRADMIGATGASSKQTRYLATLLADRGLDAEYVDCGILNFNAILTSRRASSYIDALLNPPVVPSQEEIDAAPAALLQREADYKASEIARLQAQKDDTARMDAILVERGLGHLTGADRREARRLLRRELEAKAA